jgi:queuine tRNA-ribosyltransferase
MVLDDCPALPAERSRLEEAVARTSAWARRCRDAHPGVDRQALFGIVQGGLDPELRARSAAEIAAIGFDGYAVGGLSLGETKEETAATLRSLEQHLPLDSPRYLMGVGDPLGILAGVEAGIDLFDSVWPARLGRHGHFFVPEGRLSIKPSAHARDTAPLEDGCPCEACRSLSRGALRHLFMVHDPAASRLLTLHNLTFLGRLTARLRAAIRDSRLEEEAAIVRDSWNAAPRG